MSTQSKFVHPAGLRITLDGVKTYVDNKFATKSVETELSDFKSEVADQLTMTSLTYAELVSLRDGAQLVPGHQYRITDYACTTTQENTQSAGHAFDIIVVADDVAVLNKKARAIEHEGNTYFKSDSLAKWQIWYDLNNDTSKYAWADSTNGKGVIYRMIDGWNNDCPYDFKNIQFLYNSKYYYTFTNITYNMFSGKDVYSDGSLSRVSHDNVIAHYINSGKLQLNNIIVRNSDSITVGLVSVGNNVFADNCYNIVANSGVNDNKVSNCHDITVGDSTIRISLENSSNITINSYCENVVIGSNCSNITIPAYSSNINFNINCNYITLKSTNAKSSNILQNINVYSSASGDADNVKSVTISRNNTFITEVRGSNDVILNV